jgi:hypothetical protein
MKQQRRWYHVAKHLSMGIIVLMLVSNSFYSCRTQKFYKLTSTEKSLADSVLAYALDHEALYTLLDTLKPISSVKFLRFAVAKDSTVLNGSATLPYSPAAIDSIAFYSKLCKQLSTKTKQFVLVPFKRTDNNIRNIEIYVVDKLRFASVINQYATFFGQFGITSEMSPAQVISIIEYEHKYDRWRGYGYLFGYPEYAVNFFVEAGKEQDSTGVFVERNFFQIPVYASQSGYFTYAIPKTYTPGIQDSSIYNKALDKLNEYRYIRSRYLRDNSIKAAKLFKKNHRR